MSEPVPSFPSNFLWGVATSSYQIEGGVFEDGRQASIWDTFAGTPGRILGGDTGSVACDHYHLWRDDLELLGSLGVNAYRFSVAWPRILPQGTGKVNHLGLDFYERLVDGLLERDIAPFCTLYHWDLPQALEDRGGWLNRDITEAFGEYADAVTRRLGDRVAAFATLNEPWCSAYLGYGNGHHAPGQQDPGKALQAAHYLLLAHGRALPIMRANAPAAQHGLVLNFHPSYPASDSDEDREAVRRFDGFFNRWYADPVFLGSYPEDMWQAYGPLVPSIQDGDLAAIQAPLDFLGVNYYTRAVIAHDPSQSWLRLREAAPEGVERTAMGWEVYPQALTELLVRLQRDYPLPPLYITENGAAYPDVLEADGIHDIERIRYIERHLQALHDAMRQGVKVCGYFAWSLLDNFEWAYGYSRRFGIVHVDFGSQRRTLKDSGRWYQQLIAGQRGSY